MLKVKLRRESLGMSQEELAAKAGVSRQTISYLETGAKTALSTTLIKVADALDTTVDELIAD